MGAFGCWAFRLYLTDAVSEIYSRFRIGLRGVYLEQHRVWVVILHALPSTSVAGYVVCGVAEYSNRVRAILPLTNKRRKSCKDSLTDL